MLREQLVNQDMLVLVLPALISLVEHCSEEDYKTLVQPEVKRVLTMSSGRPVQVSLEDILSRNLLLRSYETQHTIAKALCAPQGRFNNFFLPSIFPTFATCM